MTNNKKGVFVLAQSWPCNSYGGSIAVTAALKQYSIFFDNVIFICLNEFPINQQAVDNFPNVNFHHVSVKKGGFPIRFARSIMENKPAITIGMGDKNVYLNIKKNITKYYRNSENQFVGIIEDNVPGIHLKKLKREFPSMLWAFKSHDVLHKAFSIFKSNGNKLLQLAWTYEVSKIFKFEKSTVNIADFNWTITQDDLILSEKQYKTKINGVFDSDIDISKYKNVGEGDLKSIIYLGSADSRKGHGLRLFIKDSWPDLYKKYSNTCIKLALGGKNTDAFNNPDHGIHGYGFIDNELGFLEKGAIFINPQVAGSGLKLKSLIAMASGKVLITTKNGALGLGGVAGTHYLIADSTKEMITKISFLIDHKEELQKIALEGKKYVNENFSEIALTNRAQPLLQEFWNKQKQFSNE